MNTVKRLFYQTARNDIQSGDAILWSGSGAVAKLIKLWAPAGHGFSHASLVVRMDDYIKDHSVFLIEAIAKGVVPRLLSEKIRDFDGKVYWLRTTMTDEQRCWSRELALMCSAKGVKYDFWLKGLFGNALGKVNVDLKKLFCSEWVQVNWMDCGYLPRDTKAYRPWDLVKYGELVEIVPFVENQAQ